MGVREQLTVPRQGTHCSYLVRRRENIDERPEQSKRRLNGPNGQQVPHKRQVLDLSMIYQ